MVFLDQSQNEISYKMSKCPSTPIIKNINLLEEPPELNLTSRKQIKVKKRNFSFSVQKNCFEGEVSKLIDVRRLFKPIKQKINIDFKKIQLDPKYFFPSTKNKAIIDKRKKKKPLIKYF